MISNATADKIYYFIKQGRSTKELKEFSIKSNLPTYFQNSDIKIGLDQYREIILKEETGLELGGLNKKTFLEIIPINNEEIIKPEKIYLLGPEIENISETSIDFGIILLINFKERNQNNEKLFEEMRNSFSSVISDGIEGFSIRSIPKRLWCRISKKVREFNFTFEFLGNAINYLFKSKYGEQINFMEILLISSEAKKIDTLLDIITPIIIHKKKQWAEKIEEWKKRIDCDYDWGCTQCPYTDTCEEIRDVIEIREDLEK